MKKLTKYFFALGLALLISFAGLPKAQAAGTYTLTPWTYDPGNTGTVVSQATENSLHLEKNTDTSTDASAGATIYGVQGLSTTAMTLSFTVDGYCGAGAPRFNVTLENGSVIFLGCTYGNDGSGNVTFTAGTSYGGVTLPENETVKRIDIVMDEEGQTTLSNIMINGDTVSVDRNTLKIQCKNNGWKNFSSITFKNQGQCVSHFVSNKPSPSGATSMPSGNGPESMYQSESSGMNNGRQ